MYENENQSFDNREHDYHYTNTSEQQTPVHPRKKIQMQHGLPKRPVQLH